MSACDCEHTFKPLGCVSGWAPKADGSVKPIPLVGAFVDWSSCVVPVNCVVGGWKGFGG